MKVYCCQKCGTVMSQERSPSSSGCSAGGWHSWNELGKEGGKTFSCQNCGSVVSTERSPSSSGCPSGGWHSWNETGKGFGNFRSATNIKTKEQPKTKESSSSNSSSSGSSSNENDVAFKDTLIGMAASGTGKLAGKAATEVGSYAWKKVTGQKSEEDIAREKHNMEMKQAKAQLQQEKEDRKEAKKEAKRSGRNERAKELESEGKTFAAFWVRNQRWLLPLTIITAMVIIGKFMGEEEKATAPETKIETTTPKNASSPTESEKTIVSTPIDPKEQVQLFTIQDPDGYSNLRDQPDGEVLQKVNEGETFEVLGSEDDYKKIKLENGTIGFIHESRVKEVK